MSTQIRLPLPGRSYSIMIGHGILSQWPRYLSGLDLGRDAVIVSDPVVSSLHGRKVVSALEKRGYSARIFNVPQGEKSKSASCAVRLINQISRWDVDKKIFIVALGGGVIGDLAGFVAAIYKRGVPYIQLPTTLLAQIDSAIGGKTAIDLETGKNLVGAFYQPKLVVADGDVLSTLSQRQIRNGLSEAIKYGVIASLKLFIFLEKNHKKILQGDKKALTYLVYHCALIKARIVSKDEKETKGLRTVLNFGHTVGHAIEAAGHYGKYHHGEAVALGMRVAARISVDLGLLTVSSERRINQLMTAVGLPEKIEGVSLKRILDLMRHDKKFSQGCNRFVLATKIGKVKIVSNIPTDVIRHAIIRQAQAA